MNYVELVLDVLTVIGYVLEMLLYLLFAWVATYVLVEGWEDLEKHIIRALEIAYKFVRYGKI